MINSASTILSNYIPNINRFKIHSIKIERGDNPEDLYYLCQVNDIWLVIYEADYLAPPKQIIREATELFADDGVRPLHWLAKAEGTMQTLELDNFSDYKQELILRPENSYLNYAVLGVSSRHETIRHSSFTYGR